MLSALSIDGMNQCKIIEGSFTTDLFVEFIEGLLDHMQPFLQPKSVIVMDNAQIHKDPQIRELIEARGMWVMYIPPYSPDFNPIELAFLSIKAYIRHSRELAREDIDQAIDDTYVYIHLIEVAFSVTSEDTEGYFIIVAICKVYYSE
ncbi:DDE family endonuclease [Mycena venus]|uniref:DDE family endonuclease n=1 Tax=Mycena venus TaxID=2733690 RepID=A0A8H6Z453_9AGAR|nr:DDE family endonuclease [Mycena venus]